MAIFQNQLGYSLSLQRKEKFFPEHENFVDAINQFNSSMDSIMRMWRDQVKDQIAKVSYDLYGERDWLNRLKISCGLR
jgi:hypothetical protein